MDGPFAKSIDIRLVTEQDSQLLFDLMTGKNWLEHIGDRGIQSTADAKQYILDKMHPDLKVKGFINHVIIDIKTKSEVGTCSLHNREGVDGLDVGYAILEGFEGKGFASAAAREMVQLAFQSYGVDMVSAITTDENTRSCRVLEKVGFKHDGYVLLPKSDDRLKRYVLHKEGWTY